MAENEDRINKLMRKTGSFLWRLQSRGEKMRTKLNSISDNAFHPPCGEVVHLRRMITFHLIYQRCNSKPFSCSSVSTVIRLRYEAFGLELLYRQLERQLNCTALHWQLEVLNVQPFIGMVMWLHCQVVTFILVLQIHVCFHSTLFPNLKCKIK